MVTTYGRQFTTEDIIPKKKKKVTLFCFFNFLILKRQYYCSRYGKSKDLVLKAKEYLHNFSIKSKITPKLKVYKKGKRAQLAFLTVLPRGG